MALCAPDIASLRERGCSQAATPPWPTHAPVRPPRSHLTCAGWVAVGWLRTAPHRTVHHIIVLLQRTSPASTRVALGALRTSAMLTYFEAGGGTSIAAGYSTIGPRTVHHTGARASVHPGWRGRVALPPPPLPLPPPALSSFP
eukprot:COSAG01_NODE_7664_length_3109_cov_1.665337_8_plen_142_part_01